MEALLGASQSNPSCGSVAELQAPLRDLFSTRVTETRADHISVTFEIRATAVFDIPVVADNSSSSENAAAGPGNASNIDPLLGGARASVAPPVENGSGGGQVTTRRVNAIDGILNQPQDDPALQTAIVRHIIAALGQVGESSWIVRQVSRAEQGWTFTYICKDSWQAWSRQASKHPAKTAVGEWSEKGGQDPAHLGRLYAFPDAEVALLTCALQLARRLTAGVRSRSRSSSRPRPSMSSSNTRRCTGPSPS